MPAAGDDSAMLSRLPIALALMALCVAIHAAGVSWALQQLRRPHHAPRFWVGTRLFVFVSTWIVLLHSPRSRCGPLSISGGMRCRICRRRCISARSPTPRPGGDLVLAEGWRLLGAVEALTGILMCGWSTGFFFAIVNRLYEATPDAPS